MAQGISTTPDSSGPTILEIAGLELGFGERTLLRVDSLIVGPGEIVGLIGPSGSGKTTLLSSLSGQVRPKKGGFQLGGKPFGQGLRTTYVARTIQHFPLVHWETVRGNLALAARVRGVGDADFDGLLSSFSACEFAHRFPAELSGGERCRASLSQALLGEPALLLLDEPFTGLDTMVKRVVAERLFSVAQTRRTAILFVTHDLNDAIEFSNRVVVLGGRDPVSVRGEVSVAEPDAMFRINALMAGL